MINSIQAQALEREFLDRDPHVEFKLDGFKVTVQRSERKEGYYPLTVYIDDAIKAEWFDKNGLTAKAPSIAPLVYCQRIISTYTSKDKASVIKLHGKRKALKLYPKLYDKQTYYTPYHNGAKQLVKQFCKIKGISILRVGHPQMTDEQALTVFKSLADHKGWDLS